MEPGGVTSNASGRLINHQFLDATPTLKELSYYITDMAPYHHYSIGLEFRIDNRELGLIREDNISFFGLEQKCHRMLEVWLDRI